MDQLTVNWQLTKRTHSLLVFLAFTPLPSENRSPVIQQQAVSF
jgi:hypothetical protein